MSLTRFRVGSDRSLCGLSATALVDMLRRRKVSPVEVLDACLRRLAEVNPILNAVVTVREEQARAEATAIGDLLARGRECPPLAGLPVVAKDLFDFVPGIPNTFGSVPFAGFQPERASAGVQRIIDAGGVIFAKTNVSEFGHLATTDNALIGPTCSPFDLSCNAGGSSGGSAAAVAAGFAPVGTGSDGAGSIRVPAALCGLVGFKPTFGRVPSTARPNGFRAAAPFVQSGPLARSVDDAALLLSVLAGPHARDPLCLPNDGFDPKVIGDPQSLRVAYCPNLGGFPVQDEVADVVSGAALALTDVCGVVDLAELRLPAPVQELAAVVLRWMAASTADALEGLGWRFEQIGVLSETLQQLLASNRGQTVSSAKADDRLRTGVFDAFEDVFDRFDAIVAPTVCVARIPNATDGVTTGPSEIAGQPVDPSIGWSMTYPANMTGHPAASVPAGRTADGHPVGLQIIGRRFEDATVLNIARGLERARPWSHWYGEVWA